MSYKKVIATITLLLAISVGLLAQTAKSETVKIKTSAVCSQCKERIEKGLAFEKGIKDVDLDVMTKIATVRYNPLKTTPDAIRRAISKLGYDADEVKADPKAYEKLPKCCKKDTVKH
ncbi:MAG: heavy metal-associated domain-containing protein [Bacteroidota bacterium]|nr:heavy metal-associated domain-containing protein [Bacteroidota bacterium]